MEVIEFDERIADKRQAAFVIFYALDGTPWADYPTEAKDDLQGINIPTCLMINRSDGRVGFIGGMVEPGESLRGAALREVEEEVGYKSCAQLQPVVAHDIGPITTHAFMAETNYRKLRQIQEEAPKALHFGSELTGVFMPHLVNHDNVPGMSGGIDNLIRNSMAPSVREELMHFLLKSQIVDRDPLAQVCETAGYNLGKLLG